MRLATVSSCVLCLQRVATAQDSPFAHSISVYVNGNPLILRFAEGQDYRAAAIAFADEHQLANFAGECTQTKPSGTRSRPECIVDNLVAEMYKAVSFDVAQGAAAGYRSFETTKHQEVSLVVVDHFLSQPEAMRHFGLSCDFAYKGNHPGQRSASFANLLAFRPIRRAVEELIGEKLPYWFASFQRSYANDTDNGVVRLLTLPSTQALPLPSRVLPVPTGLLLRSAPRLGRLQVQRRPLPHARQSTAARHVDVEAPGHRVVRRPNRSRRCPAQPNRRSAFGSAD